MCKLALSLEEDLVYSILIENAAVSKKTNSGYQPTAMQLSPCC